MKVQINKTAEKFEPIDITFTFESQRELELLYRIVNASGNDLTNAVNACSATTLISKTDRNEIKRFTDPIFKIVRPLVKPN